MTDSILPYVKSGDGAPYLAGSRCGACGQVFVGERSTCAKCTARDKMEPIHLATTGRLYDFTIVHRSFPGVKTPFVDAIVDLDDGAHIKGTLIGVDPDPARIAFDMPVRLEFREAIPVGADRPYLTYVFVPAEGATA
ncbi:hypothetical protein GCM10011529_03530 [Polymorphobacter glacialis]|uniref:ChsH2 C-terminal OB-fold domain-containing protein n=1 Tax=Sandarakinorhabdus glacialis TaxID=1614636 RepID=A0A916ZJ84_9SPHN|nr:OB-fold domain-containing protein [Polymorphobacter glacialis]GGE00586.1 hypothetical protein GCM10011529_03530 [Polymorphobacter glacialis]